MVKKKPTKKKAAKKTARKKSPAQPSQDAANEPLNTSDSIGDVNDPQSFPMSSTTGSVDVEVEIPTEEEINKLPRWALVAFASRCARRVLPIYRINDTASKNDKANYISALERAVTLSAESASHARADRSADEVATEASNAISASISEASANAAYVAVDAILLIVDETTVDLSSMVISATHATKYLTEDEKYAFRRRLRRDFDRLLVLAEEDHWTDDTPVPQSLFDPMWPADNEPEWVREGKAWQSPYLKSAAAPSPEVALQEAIAAERAANRRVDELRDELDRRLKEEQASAESRIERERAEAIEANQAAKRQVDELRDELDSRLKEEQASAERRIEREREEAERRLEREREEFEHRRQRESDEAEQKLRQALLQADVSWNSKLEEAEKRHKEELETRISAIERQTGLEAIGSFFSRRWIFLFNGLMLLIVLMIALYAITEIASRQDLEQAIRDSITRIERTQYNSQRVIGGNTLKEANPQDIPPPVDTVLLRTLEIGGQDETPNDYREKLGLKKSDPEVVLDALRGLSERITNLITQGAAHEGELSSRTRVTYEKLMNCYFGLPLEGDPKLATWFLYGALNLDEDLSKNIYAKWILILAAAALVAIVTCGIVWCASKVSKSRKWIKEEWSIAFSCGRVFLWGIGSLYAVLALLVILWATCSSLGVVSSNTLLGLTVTLAGALGAMSSSLRERFVKTRDLNRKLSDVMEKLDQYKGTQLTDERRKQREEDEKTRDDLERQLEKAEDNMFSVTDFFIGIVTGFTVFLIIKSGRQFFISDLDMRLIAFNPFSSAATGLVAGLFSLVVYEVLAKGVDALKDRFIQTFTNGNGDSQEVKQLMQEIKGRLPERQPPAEQETPQPEQE
ncbi:hypothetical protein V22_02570 [Calycomorphotria hydatis]|uniref:Uncharacterized protein n=2 Tax=Calycomorphotria hydatis TaxID=2528027 RepID=A0A517T3V9_9PLAN|nr:hypothetical protein V22_02570 [Calycomorphotria hydatis]